jgi:hypothetical protein
MAYLAAVVFNFGLADIGGLVDWLQTVNQSSIQSVNRSAFPLCGMPPQ